MRMCVYVYIAGDMVDRERPPTSEIANQLRIANKAVFEVSAAGVPTMWSQLKQPFPTCPMCLKASTSISSFFSLGEFFSPA